MRRRSSTTVFWAAAIAITMSQRITYNDVHASNNYEYQLSLALAQHRLMHRDSMLQDLRESRSQLEGCDASDGTANFVDCRSIQS
jgi:hypothetical protein